MRLINARTLKLEEIWDESLKDYAILSHRWEDDEVCFRDMQDLAVASKRKGFAKIQKSCENALNDGKDYVWVDTCCIDKESSAELSEAINSMYRWYEASAVCYVFLSDVQAHALDGDIVKQQIKSSIWFTRGWTLQELLAPQRVSFYNQRWEFLGTKQTLRKLLALRTGVDKAVLNGEPLSGRSIAQRMSWASGRITTRIEDTAYCLLGIFDVNMPLLYGEGEKAFLRLQEQIMKQSDDHTIFAWPIHRRDQPGLLADSPTAFVNCRQVKATASRTGHSPYSMTNRGLSIKFVATPYTVDTYCVRLDCADGLLRADDDDPIDDFRLGIFLRRLNDDDQYARVEVEGETFLQMEASAWDPVSRPVHSIEMNIPQKFTQFDAGNYKDRVNGFRIQVAAHDIIERFDRGRDPVKVRECSWNKQDRIMSMQGENFNRMGFLEFRQKESKIKVMKLGFDFEYNPVCFIATEEGLCRSKLPKSKPTLNRDGESNIGDVSQEPRWTEEEREQLYGIHERSPFDTKAWSSIYGVEAVALRLHPGLWALKGDRVNGLSISIQELASLQIERGRFEDKLIWDVYLQHV